MEIDFVWQILIGIGFRGGQQAGGIRFQLVQWKAKETSCLTLITDGCSKGNPGWSDGSGILRDSLGRPKLAFSAFFRRRSSLHAGALALLTGLRLCVGKGFVNVAIQSDSQVLVRILQRRFQCLWQIRNEVEQIWELVEDVVRVSHCFREANRVVDILANVVSLISNILMLPMIT
ncbi:uncharacterized protein [Coffea arabica]|uniref:RNase H type-1 domain-containing protein n=1 Tax=Coffea arabica TaxID=13443 RepID=A0ABM4UR47_COFAR